MFYKAMSIFVKKHFRQRPAWLYNFFLHAAIFLRGAASAISRMIKIKKKTKQKLSLPSKVIIAGSEMEFTMVKRLLEKSSQNKIVSGRVEMGKISKQNIIAGFPALQHALSVSSAEEIIFCEGDLSFREIISAMRMIPQNIAIKIFANASHSIIGSANKDECGEVILEKENPFYPAQ
jgi:hypothetical protein